MTSIVNKEIEWLRSYSRSRPIYNLLPGARYPVDTHISLLQKWLDVDAIGWFPTACNFPALWHPNLTAHNILYDRDQATGTNVISGIIGWQGACVRPLVHMPQPPYLRIQPRQMLTHEGKLQRSDSDGEEDGDNLLEMEQIEGFSHYHKLSDGSWTPRPPPKFKYYPSTFTAKSLQHSTQFREESKRVKQLESFLASVRDSDPDLALKFWDGARAAALVEPTKLAHQTWIHTPCFLGHLVNSFSGSHPEHIVQSAMEYARTGKKPDPPTVFPDHDENIVIQQELETFTRVMLGNCFGIDVAWNHNAAIKAEHYDFAMKEMEVMFQDTLAREQDGKKKEMIKSNWPVKKLFYSTTADSCQGDLHPLVYEELEVDPEQEWIWDVRDPPQKAGREKWNDFGL
jgi:hypothetical protein